MSRGLLVMLLMVGGNLWCATDAGQSDFDQRRSRLNRFNGLAHRIAAAFEANPNRSEIQLSRYFIERNQLTDQDLRRILNRCNIDFYRDSSGVYALRRFDDESDSDGSSDEDEAYPEAELIGMEESKRQEKLANYFKRIREAGLTEAVSDLHSILTSQQVDPNAREMGTPVAKRERVFKTPSKNDPIDYSVIGIPLDPGAALGAATISNVPVSVQQAPSRARRSLFAN